MSDQDFDFSFEPEKKSISNSSSARTSVHQVGNYVAELLESLNEPQRKAVLHTKGPLIVLAGAGSGKTKMLTSRIAYLIDSGRAMPSEVLAVTFTNKAAGEMRNRVSKQLGGTVNFGPVFAPRDDAPEIGTFHSMCTRLLRREMASTPYTLPFVIYDDADQLSLVKKACEQLAIDAQAFNPKSFQGAINRAKCDALEPHEIAAGAHDLYTRKLKQVYEVYQRELFAANAIDFGEILCMAYRLLRDRPEIRAKYQKRWQYIHVDEYQDTNRVQYLMLSLLAQARHGGHENICVVGDEDQSIYKWRGADIRNILQFEQDYSGAEVVKLEQNYRSTQTIIQAASKVISHNTERKNKTLWTANPQGVLVDRVQVADEKAEADLVISEIKRLARDSDYSFKDFSVFYRTHAQSRQFEEALRRERIPYQIFGGMRFYDRKEIKDILSYFKVLLNPTDEVSLKRIINTPARGIGKSTLEKIDELQSRQRIEGRQTSWADALMQAANDASITSAGTARKLREFTQVMGRLAQVRAEGQGLAALYLAILDATGYTSVLRAEDTEESLGRIENLEELSTVLQEFDEEHSEIPREQLLALFLEQSALMSAADSGEDGKRTQVSPQDSAVSLMTLHASKGLEFLVVFLTGMEDGVFPSIRPTEDSAEDDSEIEEERRLCYVGMTRARERLFLTHAKIRRIWGQTRYQEPARFFDEMPTDTLDFRDLSFGAEASRYRTGSSRTMGGEFGYQGSESASRSVSATAPLRSSTASESWVNRHVDHPQFGYGTITQSEGAGDDCKVVIRFKNGSQRKFLFKYVKGFMD